MRGNVEANGVRLVAGDAAMVLNESCLELRASASALELLMISLRD